MIWHSNMFNDRYLYGHFVSFAKKNCFSVSSAIIKERQEQLIRVDDS